MARVRDEDPCPAVATPNTIVATADLPVLMGGQGTCAAVPQQTRRRDDAQRCAGMGEQSGPRRMNNCRWADPGVDLPPVNKR